MTDKITDEELKSMGFALCVPVYHTRIEESFWTVLEKHAGESLAFIPKDRLIAGIEGAIEGIQQLDDYLNEAPLGEKPIIKRAIQKLKTFLGEEL